MWDDFVREQMLHDNSGKDGLIYMEKHYKQISILSTGSNRLFIWGVEDRIDFNQ